MKSNDLLAKHCQTPRERKLVERYIQIATIYSHYWLIILICGLFTIVCTALQARFHGFNHSSFWLGGFSSVLLLLTAQNMWRAKTIGTVLKRISESK